MSHDHHDHDSPEYLRKQSNLVWIIGGVLFVATFITVGAMYVDMGSRSMNIAFGILIATIKASLVILIFMHLKNERGLIYKFLAFTVIFVIGLFALTYLGFLDPLHSHEILTK